MASTRTVLSFLVLALIAATLAYLGTSCTPPERQDPERSSHGFRIWSGATLTSFEHTGGRVCVPESWTALGYEQSGAGWATFETGKTGMLIRSDAFASKALAFENSAYAVTLYYPKNLKDLPLYEETVRNAFERIGKLYADKRAPQEHTVLITAGIPFSDEEEDSIYPDPRANISFLILKPDHSRSEQLFFHAIAHLYNRYDPPERGVHEEPLFPASDWSEFEASWIELGLASSDTFRNERLAYLQNVHEAVVTRDYSRIKEEPFNDLVAFEAMQGVATTDWQSSYLDYQYAHYVLAPLIMVGIDGLLAFYETGTDVKTLLTRVHDGTTDSFFGEVERLLPPEASERIQRWIRGEEAIGRDLVVY